MNLIQAQDDRKNPKDVLFNDYLFSRDLECFDNAIFNTKPFNFEHLIPLVKNSFTVGNEIVYSRKNTVKVGFEYFWKGYLDSEERPFVLHLLSLIQDSLYEKNLDDCDLIFHSHFGNHFQNFRPGKKYVFFSGEKYTFPSEKYDLCISFLPDAPNSVCYPFFATVMHTYEPRYDMILTQQNYNDIPKEFCAFVVGNPNCEIRNSFFTFVCKNYKKVVSYGKVMNNVGFQLNFPYNDKRQLELLGRHKFVICFENTKTDNYYVTEKIMIAKAAGCVPIYWGSKKCLEIFNKNSFLYLEDETPQEFERLLSKIRILDSNDKLYLYMRNLPLLSSASIEKFSKTNLRNQMNKILFTRPVHPYLKNLPRCYYINLQRSIERNNHMIRLFQQYGITNYQRIDAIDGQKIVHTEPRLLVSEEACTLSHLKAIETFYKSGLEDAIIFEDDISMEFINRWKTPLEQIIKQAPKDCEILQLAYTLYPHNFCHIKQDYNPFLLVTFNGAMAYYIKRKGAEKILENHNCSNPRLNEYLKIRPVSDVIIYDYAKTYTYKYCLFTYPDDNQSTIHNFHLGIHINSKACAVKVYDTM